MVEERSGGERRAAASWRLGGVAAGLVLVALVVATRLAIPLEPLDDAFLLLAVVRNFLLGGGPHLLFGGEDAALSTLAWPVLVALPAALGVDLPRALAGMGLAAEIGAALAVRRLALALSGSSAAALFAAAAFATQPVYLLSTLGGMETALYCAALAWGARAAIERRGGELAAAAALLAWTRVEGVALALLLLALGGWERRRARRALAPIAGGAALVLAAPWAHLAIFGSWLPSTVAAKAAAGGSSLEGAASVALELARAPLGMSAYWLVRPSVHAVVALVAVAGLVRLGRDDGGLRRAAPALLPALLHGALFVVAGRGYATNFPWYFAPPLVAVAALTAVGAARPLARLERWAAARALGAPAVPAVVALALWLAAAPSLHLGIGRVRASFTAHRERAYAAAALWLTRVGEVRSIASNEVGTLAFFAPPGTEIVDLFGIARPRGLAGASWLELVDATRPAAVVTRADFRYRRELERLRPEAFVWARVGALDLGLRPSLAERLRPASDELTRLYLTLDLERDPPETRRAPARAPARDSAGGE